jgi:rubrerythrin
VSTLETLAKKLSNGGKGGKVTERPQTQFPIGGQSHSVLAVAAKLENVGAAAYLGQLTVIENREVLAIALSIHSVEGRHAAKLSQLTGRRFDPNGAFASPLEMGEVMDAVQPYIA